MINVTPDTDRNSQVTRGDKVRVSWLLDAQVDPDRIELEIPADQTYSGNELSEEEVNIDGERLWRYYRDFVLPMPLSQMEWRLSDSVNEAKDTSYITAKPSIS